MTRQDGRSRQVSEGVVDDFGATILHVDMDAFFASVELLDQPELRGKPVIVGHAVGRSIVTTATYEARKYGVTSAMPMSKALRLCPNAIVLPPRHALYHEYSKRVMGILTEMTPLVEQLSIDEAFLDVSGARRLLGAPSEIGARIRTRVFEETGLTCSVGVAATKFVAKLASTLAKPDGLLVVAPQTTLSFLRPLPIRALWGVGGKTGETLDRLGLRTVGDVADVPLPTLRKALGDASGIKLHELANGRDPRAIETTRVEKSIGHEVTFHQDVGDAVRLKRELLRLSDQVAVRLRNARLEAKTVSIKVRYEDFTTVTRSRTLAEPSNVGRRIYEESLELFDSLGSEIKPVRLIGVRAENLVGDGGSSAALWDPDEGWREAENTIDSLRARFGTGAVTAASLLTRGDAKPDTAGGTRRPAP